MRKRVLATALVSVGLAVGAGVAWAGFISTGSATASGTSGNVQMPTAVGVLPAGQTLYPGVRRNIRVTVTNPNNFPVVVTRVEKSPNPVVVDPAHAAACVTTGVSLTNPPYGVAWNVPAGATRTFQLTNGMRMTNASQNGCQGATFKVPIVITARSA
jgi:hypothetical protein